MIYKTKKFILKDDTVEKGAFCTIKSKKTYGFDTEPTQYLVDSFSFIGWPDPFTKPITTGDPDSKAKISEDDIADYKKDCRKANNAIIKKDKYIFKTENIDPTSVKKIYYNELFSAKLKRKFDLPAETKKEKSFADI